MKRLILLLLISMMFLSVFAEEKSIELKKMVYGPERRSLTFTPTVTHDGNILHIYSEIPLDNLQVTITDLSTDNTFSYDNIIVLYGQPYALFLDNADSGTYKIELKIGYISYYGFFDL